MNETYGEMLSDLVDDMAKYEERPAIFRRNDISRNHFYNVTNPNRETNSGNRYPCPTEWGVLLTKDSKNYRWIKTVARDCGGIFISPEDIKELNSTNPERTLEVFQKIIGFVNKK
jgi:hypothetical protein